MRPVPIVTTALLLAAAAPADSGGPLQITVSGVPDTQGHVLAAVCDRSEFLQPVCRLHGGVASQAGTVTIILPHVPPGIWAVQAYHDANDNHRIDRTWLGMPTEAMGFSNDAKMHFGPPRFNDAAFELGPQGGAVGVVLHRY